MARITGMIKLYEILRRIKNGLGANEILRQTGAHKDVIRKVRLFGESQGWLSPDAAIPDETIVHRLYREQVLKKASAHILDPFLDEIKSWREAGESYVVIREKIFLRLGSVSISDTALRNYCKKYILTPFKPVIRREQEPSVAELDFGFLGKMKLSDQSIRKIWVLSLRFRYSRHAYRCMLLKTDAVSVIKALHSAFRDFGGVPKRLVIDNFKAAISKAHRTDPTVTKTFYEFLKHYGILLDPCKPYSPQHKGGVESDIKYIKGNFLPLFRDHESLSGNNVPRSEMVDEALAKWNTETADKRKIREVNNRIPEELFRTDFEELLPLPQDRFEIAIWADARVGNDWHVRFDSSCYSAPCALIRKSLQLRATDETVELYHEHELVASHKRSHIAGERVTVKQHGPEAAMEYLESNRDSVEKKAAFIGPETLSAVRFLLDDKVIIRLRAARGIVALTNRYPNDRIERACARALSHNIVGYQSVKLILEKGLDQEPDCPVPDGSGQLHFQFSRDHSHYKYN